MKFNWDQSGMPAALVSGLGRRREFTEFKSVLNGAQSHVLRTVDVEAMARALVESGGREFVEMVRELTVDLENAKRELEEANRRCERLTAELRRRGVRVGGETPSRKRPKPPAPPDDAARPLTEWDEWDLRFRALLASD